MKYLTALTLLAAGWMTPDLSAQSPAVLSASNGIGRMSVTPAATLLLPYFETDLSTGETTLMTLHNAAPAPAVAQLTLWTDVGVQSMNFNIFLSGYDVVRFDLGDFFRNGTIPETGPSLNPAGELSEPNSAPPACPFPLPPSIPAVLLTYVRNAHTGQPIPAGFEPAGLCAGRPSGSKPRGFVTVDVVNDCSLAHPGTLGYFQDGGYGIASNRNVLWGDFRRKLDGQTQLQAEPLVHIEARGSLADGFWEAGDYSFYGRFLGAAGIDNREPLPTAWGVFYDVARTGGGATELIYWRDSGVRDEFFPCGSLPPAYPLDTGRVILFDEEENAVEMQAVSPFPWAADRSPVDLHFNPIFERGWIFLDFNGTELGRFAPVGQGWLAAKDTRPTGSSSYPAIAFDNALSPRHLDTAVLPIFYDGFESGDSSRWTATAGGS